MIIFVSWISSLTLNCFLCTTSTFSTFSRINRLSLIKKKKRLRQIYLKKFQKYIFDSETSFIFYCKPWSFFLGVSRVNQIASPVQRSPDSCHRLPIQKPTDNINCGVFVCLCMFIYFFGPMSNQYIGDLLTRSIGECRLLLLSWILRGELFFLSFNSEQQ